jgi:hypothetical protein
MMIGNNSLDAEIALQLCGSPTRLAIGDAHGCATPTAGFTNTTFFLP